MKILSDLRYYIIDEMKISFKIYRLIVAMAFITVIGCAPDRQKTSEELAIDTSLFKKLDSLPVISKHRLLDTLLTITADSVVALYYPNTGKSVMTLHKGDICTVTRTSRYDVIDGKGNFWIRVERYGGKGWIFGGETSLASDVWIFEEEMELTAHPFNKYRLHKISTSSFENLFSRVAGQVKNFDYEDDDSGSRETEVDDNEIITQEDAFSHDITERFVPGPTLDSLGSINYYYQSNGEDTTTYSHCLIYSNGTRTSFIADMIGELKSIYKKGNNFVLISEYTLENSGLGRVHCIQVVTLSQKEKKIIKRRQFGHSAVNPVGAPIFRRWDDGSFIFNTEFNITADGELALQFREIYNRTDANGKTQENAFYITRYFTYNDTEATFLESRQEIIYEAK